MTWLRRILGARQSASAGDTLDDLQAAWHLWDLMRRLEPGERRALFAEAERLAASREGRVIAFAAPRRAH